MLDGLNYNSGDHSYKYLGKPLPGVTTMIADSGYAESGASFYTSASRQRGNAVHRVRFLIDQHCPEATTLDEVLTCFEALDARLHPFAAGYVLFKRETGFKPVLSEQAVASIQWRYAGTLDIHGLYGDGRKVLVDTKGWQSQGKEPKRHAVLQTAAYKIAVKESERIDTDLRVILNFPGNGSYRAYECTDPQDELLIKNIAVIYWDRVKHGYVKVRGEE